MKDTTDLAIVLRSFPYEDRHQIVTVLTQLHGKITAMARNSIQSKRFGSALEAFCASNVVWNSKGSSEFFLLKEAETKYTFSKIKSHFDNFIIASFCSEVLAKIAPINEPCEILFKLHSNTLKALETKLSIDRLCVLMSAYFIKLLHWAGNQPQTKECLDCKKSIKELDENITFIIPDAGWICDSCKPMTVRNLSHDYTLELSTQEILYLHISSSFSVQDYLQKSTDLNGIKQFELTLKLLCYHMPGFELSQMKSYKLLEPLVSPQTHISQSRASYDSKQF